jgi:hypothetical protein
MSENSLITDSTQNSINAISESINKILDGLENGERATLHDIIDKVIAETGVQISMANGLVPTLVRNYPGVEIEKGRNGGVFKGGKPKHIDARPRCDTCHQVVRVKPATE